jgi:mono/diheme cytochrome c family protein
VKRSVQLATLAAVVALISLLASARQAAAIQSAAMPVDFNRDIRPILSDSCFACHGPDEGQRMAKLRLDTREGALAKQGVIVPGDAAASRLVKRISSKDPNTVMPPPDSGHRLTEQQIELIRRWVNEGAQWSTHWAYQPPVRPEPPKVGNAAWVRNPIDNFILARLEKEGLKPSPEADKTTLLRRVTLDLTGLPPTPAEVDSFLADKSPDAYEKAVDRLLASPHYGERMAMQWLDLARYADTHGYHIDSHRDMWPWRDWLIRSFNQNKPFDQFTVEQLAGDLLPKATTDQKIASGFNRNHMINFEGGAIPEEYQMEYVVDRVEATATTWMAMTMGCARCHTHKYDPISHKEFYQFFAFFNNVPEKGLDGRDGNAAPFLQLPSDDQKAELERVSARIQSLNADLTDKQVQPLQDEWEKQFAGQVAPAPREGLTAHYELDGGFSDLSGRYQHGRTIKGDPTFNAGQVGRAVKFDGDSHVTFGNVGCFDRNEAFTLAVWLKGEGNLPTGVLHKIEDAETRRGYEIFLEGRELVGIQKWASHVTVRLTSRWPGSAIQIRSRKRLRLGDWNHVALAYDGLGKAAGLKLYLNGEPHDAEVLQDNLSGPIKTDADLQIGNKDFGKPYRGQLDDLRFYSRALNAHEIERLAVHYPIETIISGVNGKRSKEDAARVRDHFLTHAAPAEMKKAFAEVNELKKRRDALNKEILSVMVMGEMPKARETFVLARGDYRNRTEKVEPGVPAVLPPLPKDEKVNRLTLAKWLVDPQHPLTSRVAVNRYWQTYFGHGIVKTSEDFGSQGEPPVHPELLDWLATEFVRTGWDVKAMQKLIVTSATYRQSSKVTPALYEKDPENRLLARGPRFRLQAEVIRDTALAASGLLNNQIGGPSVMPYQPPGLWEEMAFGDGFTAQSYVESKGRDLYRRSMYTFWKRTVPPASLATFDAPDREKCVARRAVTNTPLQALVLLNDPTYVEAARLLAARALGEGGKGTSERIAYAFRLATSRAPSKQESRVLGELYAKQLARYRRDGKAAGELLRVGESRADEKLAPAELAAWTVVASAILNLDETVTKE